MVETKLKIKTVDDLEKLNTPNLLRYYKAERKRFYRFTSGNICDCCGNFSWELDSKIHEKDKITYHKWEEYLGTIKTVLSKREHVERK